MESLFLFKKLPKLLAVVIIATLFVQGCGPKSRDLPVNKIKRALQKIPTYSVILEDMKEEGDFMWFHSTLPHRTRNPAKQKSIAIWVGIPPF